MLWTFVAPMATLMFFALLSIAFSAVGTHTQNARRLETCLMFAAISGIAVSIAPEIILQATLYQAGRTPHFPLLFHLAVWTTYAVLIGLSVGKWLDLQTLRFGFHISRVYILITIMEIGIANGGGR